MKPNGKDLPALLNADDDSGPVRSHFAWDRRETRGGIGWRECRTTLHIGRFGMIVRASTPLSFAPSEGHAASPELMTLARQLANAARHGNADDCRATAMMVAKQLESLAAMEVSSKSEAMLSPMLLRYRYGIPSPGAARVAAVLLEARSAPLGYSEIAIAIAAPPDRVAEFIAELRDYLQTRNLGHTLSGSPETGYALSGEFLARAKAVDPFLKRNAAQTIRAIEQRLRQHFSLGRLCEARLFARLLCEPGIPQSIESLSERLDYNSGSIKTIASYLRKSLKKTGQDRLLLTQRKGGSRTPGAYAIDKAALPDLLESLPAELSELLIEYWATAGGGEIDIGLPAAIPASLGATPTQRLRAASA